MISVKSFVVLTALLAVAFSKPSILLPLYIYPETAATWKPVFDAIKANPTAKFDVIVNVENGPGNSVYPDSDYIDNVANLNAFKNVRILGYVHTSYGKRAAAAINADVTKYANWKNYAKKNITVRGIFFDETPEEAKYLSYMTELSSK